jgi:hypothetical protein
MNRLLALVLLTLISSIVRAEDLLVEIQKNMIDAPLIKGYFSQTRVLDGVAKPLKSQGYFIVDRSRGVVWVTEKPFSGSLRVTKNEILQKSENQILMKISAESEPAVKSVNEVLFTLFSGDVASLKKYFSYTGEFNKGSWFIRLKPTQGGMGKLIKSINMEGRLHVDKMTLEMETKDVTHIFFSETRSIKALSENEATYFK